MKKFQKVSLKIEVMGSCLKSILFHEEIMVLLALIEVYLSRISIGTGLGVFTLYTNANIKILSVENINTSNLILACLECS